MVASRNNGTKIVIDLAIIIVLGLLPLGYVTHITARRNRIQQLAEYQQAKQARLLCRQLAAKAAINQGNPTMNTVIKSEFDREKSIELLVDKILDDLDWNTLHQMAAESLYSSYSKDYSDDELRSEMDEYGVEDDNSTPKQD
jgi:uncharacterized membrane protein YcjF (UPF0283 family)